MDAGFYRFVLPRAVFDSFRNLSGVAPPLTVDDKYRLVHYLTHFVCTSKERSSQVRNVLCTHHIDVCEEDDDAEASKERLVPSTKRLCRTSP